MSKRLDVDRFVVGLGEALGVVDEQIQDESINNGLFYIFTGIKDYAEKLAAEDRYRWHDLRLDPNDLPDDMRTVRVCIQHTGDNEKFYDDARYFGNNCDEWTRMTGLHCDKNAVIAWREIEPFETC